MPPPAGPPYRFLLTDYHHGFALGQLHIKVTTDTPSHLWCRYTHVPLRLHMRSDDVRGIKRLGDPQFCFVEWQNLEQLEPGDTLHHRFHMPAFGTGQERWFHFWGTTAGILSRSVSAIFHVKYHEESQMITLGIFGEAQTLEGEVKLEPGDNIVLVRNDGHNSIEIHATAGPIPDGFGMHWTTDILPPGAPVFPHWEYDQLHVGISSPGQEARIYTARQTIFNFIASHSWELAAERGPATILIDVWLAMVASAVDLDADPTHRHIGWYHSNNRLWATNADGVAQTRTLIGVGRLAARRWLRYHRHGVVIDFYEDNILVATHNTNIPGALGNCRWLSQYISHSVVPVNFDHTQPRYLP